MIEIIIQSGNSYGSENAKRNYTIENMQFQFLLLINYILRKKLYGYSSVDCKNGRSGCTNFEC